jgi:hypothetical protein
MLHPIVTRILPPYSPIRHLTKFWLPLTCMCKVDYKHSLRARIKLSILVTHFIKMYSQHHNLLLAQIKQECVYIGFSYFCHITYLTLHQKLLHSSIFNFLHHLLNTHIVAPVVRIELTSLDLESNILPVELYPKPQ